MSKDYKVELYGQPNIYTGYSSRKINIYFSEPQNGVNNETGIVLLIAGFGGSATSNVYEKMRSSFADKYNLVTIQCDYFGHQFMMDEKKISGSFSTDALKKIFQQNEISEMVKNGQLDLKLLFQIGSKYNYNCSINAVMEENMHDFNDMGIMQAMDNLVAVFSVLAILKDNELSFNMKKIIAYGHSHGAYLCYLCNKLSPGLFDLIIDNSAWLTPVYLNTSRFLYKQIGRMKLSVQFDYMARKLKLDREILSLEKSYRNFNNNCHIIAFQGTDDQLVNWRDKQKFCRTLPNSELHLIGQSEVDGRVFRSTTHGLNADFLKLFDEVMSHVHFDLEKKTLFQPINFKTSGHSYSTHYVYDMIHLEIGKN